MPRPSSPLRLILVAACCGAFAACTSHSNVGKSGNDASYNKVTGVISTTVSAPLDRAFEASRAAMQDMQYRVDSANKDALKGVVEAREADGHKVTATTRRKSDDQTEISVDVGVAGSESKAKMILDKIVSRL